MIRLMIAMLLLTSTAFASDIAFFNQDNTLRFYRRSLNTPDFEGRSDVLINPIISHLDRVPRKFWKRQSNIIREMNNAEKRAVADAEQAVVDTRNAQRATDLQTFGINQTQLDALKRLVNN